jgi:hypothetical protein
MGETMNAYKILMVKLNEKRPLKRQKESWEDGNIRINMA